MKKTENKDFSISFVGSGRVATHLAMAFAQAGFKIAGIFSRNVGHAGKLAAHFGKDCQVFNDLAEIPETDVVFFCISDDALPHTLQLFQQTHPHTASMLVHTAGSVSINVFEEAGMENVAKHFGVLYPLQSFSDGRNIDLSHTPAFVEGNNEASLQTIENLARHIFRNVSRMDSEHRRFLHLAGVFANNFTNHCYNMAANLVAKSGANFDVLLPIIEETAEKVKSLPPSQAQTGPAARHDLKTIESHLELLQNHAPELVSFYKMMSESIMKENSKDKS